MVATQYRNHTDGQLMALVPAGPAIFGSAEGVGDDDERPAFEASLPDYYLGVTCVTNRQYAAFLTAASASRSVVDGWITLGGGCFVRASGAGYEACPSMEEHPVVQVAWHGVVAYCEWAGLRLPTELEWEKGARGTDGRLYPWGDEWDPSRCRHPGNSAGGRTCDVWAHPEGASPYGLLNMSGNVWEMCADWYDRKAYSRYAEGDLTPAPRGRGHVIRGGAWNRADPLSFRCAKRERTYTPPDMGEYEGFRCCRSAGEL